MKECSFCREAKALSDYYKDSRAKDGHTSRCKACVNADSKTWKKQNAERYAEYRTAYYEKNKAKLITIRSAWAKVYADKVKSYERKWREANAQRLKEKNQQRHQANSADRKAMGKAWRKDHPEKVAEYRRKHADEAKAMGMAWRKDHPEKVAEYRRKHVDEVSQSYVANLLEIPTAKVTPELLQMKRDEIALRRMARTLKKASNENQQNG